MVEFAYESRVLNTFPKRADAGTNRSLSVPQMLYTVPQHDLAFSVVQDLQSLAALRNEWIALFHANGQTHQVFQTYAWVQQWCDYFLTDTHENKHTQLNIVTARRDGVLVMVMPLVRVCKHAQCRIEWLGAPVSQYGDVLVANVPDARRIVAAGFDFVVQNSGSDVIVLRKVRSDSLAARVLKGRTPTEAPGELAPAISLPSDTSFDDFQQRYPAKARKNRRRHRRRLMECGDVTFDVLTKGPEAADLIRTALEFKRTWLVNRRLVSVAFADPNTDRFFVNLPDDLGMLGDAQCKLLVYVLRCDRRPIAINVAFRSGDRLLTHIASYDLAFEKFSPGSLLFEQSISHSLENGIALFDLMSPGDAYKLDWTDTGVQVHDYAFGLTRRGKAYETFYLRRLRPALKQAANRLPGVVRPFKRFLNA